MTNIINLLAKQVVEGKVKIESVGNYNNMQDEVRKQVNKIKSEEK